ncbi:MAG: glutathione S-transferase N-terminal domain-containing protein [Pseudomonadota bacterium]
MMKLYFHPLSPASQPVLLFCADASIAYEPVIVDIMTGEHHQERFIALNPNALVPVLQDGDFVLTESAAILRYLADAVDSRLYPKDLKARARVNERMDWFNSNFYRELGYHLVYPQLFPPSRARSGSGASGDHRLGSRKGRTHARHPRPSSDRPR